MSASLFLSWPNYLTKNEMEVSAIILDTIKEKCFYNFKGRKLSACSSAVWRAAQASRPAAPGLSGLLFSRWVPCQPRVTTFSNSTSCCSYSQTENLFFLAGIWTCPTFLIMRKLLTISF